MKTKNLVGSVLVVGALVALITSSMQSQTLRSIPVSELREGDYTPRSYVGQTLRVVGTITHDPVQRIPQRNSDGVIYLNHFRVQEKGKEIQVEYGDALPDTFHPGGSVQIDGQYVSPGKVVAKQVFTKCPSKYDGPGQQKKQQRVPAGHPPTG